MKHSKIETYFVFPAMAAFIWLVFVTNWQDFSDEWLIFCIALVLHLAFSWLNLSTLLEGEMAKVPGSHGRFITWAAMLLIGPIALWIDMIGAWVRMGYGWRNGRLRQLDGNRNWLQRMQPVLITLVRDTLVGLIAVSLLSQWGGDLPLFGLNGSGVDSALGIMWVRMGLVAVVMTAVFLIQGYGRSDSLLDRGQQLFKFSRAVFLFYILPEPFSVLAVVNFEQMGSWGFLLFWVSIFLVGLLGGWLQKTAVFAQQRAQTLYQLEQLAEDILREPADDADLPSLLEKYVPNIFKNGWVEIRQLPDNVLFAQGEGWIPAPDEAWARLVDCRNDYLLLSGIHDAADFGFGMDALLIPIWHDEQLLGGIYLMRLFPDDVRHWEEAGLALAAQIGAGLQRSVQLQMALDSQATAYEEAVYQQAYQAEVYAQALAYEKISQELAVAGKIQMSFLPQELPQLAGWQLAVTLEPARETSGDFYDFIELGNGRLGLIVADVADKGMGAALYMALSRTLIRTFASEFAQEPEKALAAANRRILKDTTSDLFATVFYGILEPETGLLTYCNAGHNPPYLQSPNGEKERLLTRTALPIGIFDDVPWAHDQITIKPGELLVMYTDGVVEAEDEVQDYFSEAQLQSVTRANLGRSIEVIENKVITAVYEFVGDAPQLDDITLMLLKRESS